MAEKELYGYGLGLRLAMKAKVPDHEGMTATLRWDMRDGHPRATVWYNDKNSQNNKEKNFLIAATDSIAFEMMLHGLEEMINDDTGAELRNKLTCLGAVYLNGQIAERRALKSEIWYGRTKDGIYWISPQAAGKPKVVFTFNISEWHEIYKNNGDKLSPAESSKWACKVYIRQLKEFISNLLARYAEDYRYVVKNADRDYGNRNVPKVTKPSEPAPATKVEPVEEPVSDDLFGDLDF